MRLYQAGLQRDAEIVDSLRAQLGLYDAGVAAAAVADFNLLVGTGYLRPEVRFLLPALTNLRLWPGLRRGLGLALACHAGYKHDFPPDVCLSWLSQSDHQVQATYVADMLRAAAAPGAPLRILDMVGDVLADIMWHVSQTYAEWLEREQRALGREYVTRVQSSQHAGVAAATPPQVPGLFPGAVTWGMLSALFSNGDLHRVRSVCDRALERAPALPRALVDPWYVTLFAVDEHIRQRGLHMADVEVQALLYALGSGPPSYVDETSVGPIAQQVCAARAERICRLELDIVRDLARAYSSGAVIAAGGGDHTMVTQTTAWLTPLLYNSMCRQINLLRGVVLMGGAHADATLPERRAVAPVVDTPAVTEHIGQYVQFNADGTVTPVLPVSPGGRAAPPGGVATRRAYRPPDGIDGELRGGGSLQRGMASPAEITAHDRNTAERLERELQQTVTRLALAQMLGEPGDVSHDASPGSRGRVAREPRRARGPRPDAAGEDSHTANGEDDDE